MPHALIVAEVIGEATGKLDQPAVEVARACQLLPYSSGLIGIIQMFVCNPSHVGVTVKVGSARQSSFLVD